MPSIGGEQYRQSGGLDRTIDAVHDLADYAQARGLDTANELLTDLLAVLYSRSDAVGCLRQLASENRAMNVLRLMCLPDTKVVPHSQSSVSKQQTMGK
ncbi:hypothetical protein [Muricoccus radiodurans]|uniref:hypothetical protein n=1 Tax=Muricoccus radiodurans TaxID=2231721 RepID=UPI003CF2BABE